MKALSISIVIILTGICVTFAAEQSDPCAKVDYSWLNSHSPMPPPPSTLMLKRPVNGLCEIILQYQSEYIPIYAGPDYIITGEMIKDGVQVTQARLAEIQKAKFKNLLQDLEKIVAITYEPKLSVNEIYIISSPSCPHCKNLIAEIKDIADVYNTKINIILYPLLGDKSESEKCIEAVCQNYDLNRYIKGEYTIMPDKSVQCKNGVHLVSKTKKILEDAGIKLVPIAIMPDGSYVIGADVDAIRDLIAGA